MKAYVIANIDVKDPTRYADYIKLTPATAAPVRRTIHREGRAVREARGCDAREPDRDPGVPEL